MILSLVAEDHMNLLSSRSTDIRPKHNIVGRLSMHVLLVHTTIEELDISTSAVDVLLVLHRELDDQRLVLVGDRGVLGRDGIELGVLRGLETLVLLLVSVELARAHDKLTKVVLVLGLHPSKKKMISYNFIVF